MRPGECLPFLGRSLILVWGKAVQWFSDLRYRLSPRGEESRVKDFRFGPPNLIERVGGLDAV